jgi:hypothetical protein
MTNVAVQGARPADPFEVMKWQNDVIRKKQYEFLGLMWKIVIEASAGANVPGKTETDVEGVSLDFMGEKIAVAQSAGELLILSPFIRRSDGRVGLPDKPDPTWVPGAPRWSDADDPKFDRNHPKGKLIHDQPRMLPQTLRTRGAKALNGAPHILVIEPVYQVLVMLEGVAEGVIVQCATDPATGTHKALVVNENTGEAHFYGGRHIVNRVG